ncbi:MAG: ATP-binding protein [Bacteroidales bacterium]
MDKNTIKKIILENQSRISSLQIVKRDYSVEAQANYIFTGQRRVGKTYFVLSLVQDLINEGLAVEAVLHINFEDERLIGLDITELDEILESYQELFKHKPVLFFDEIQNISGWQKFARRMADSGFKIYITGSNSEMLSGEMASTLGGRFMVMEIETLSFKEFLLFHKIEPTENIEFSSDRFDVIRLFDSYFSEGGFPELFKYVDKKEYLSNIFQKVFLGDIISRYQIRNPFALKLLIKKLAESTMDEVSYNRMRNIIVSTIVQIATTTVIEYVKYLEDSFLISSLENYNAKISSRESKKKYYFRDNGILSLFLIDPASFQLETLVFNKLRTIYKANCFYLRNGYEVDFFIPGEALIQVCFSIDEPATRTREISALLKAKLTHPVKNMTIITYSTEEIVTIETSTISIVPVWKWILKAGI